MIQTMRNDVASHFLWALAQELAKSVDISLAMPHVIGKGKQVHRSNAHCGTVEEYYRTNLYIPFLDHILSQMTQQFSGHFEVMRQ